MPNSTDQKIQTTALVVIAGIMTAASLFWLRPVMIPFVLAMLLTYALSPLVELLVQRANSPRWLGILIALAVGLAILILVGGLVSSSVRTLGENADLYGQRLTEIATRAGDQLRTLGFEVGASSLESQLRDLPLGQYVGKAAGAVLGIISNTFLVLIFAIYLLQGQHPNEKKGAMREDIDHRIERYLLIKLGLSAVTGILVGLAPLVLVNPEHGTMTIVLALALPGLVQLVVGNIIEPKMMGDSLELHPITILLALIFWGMLWGIPGMLLAAPITAVLRIFLDALDTTRPVARLLAGQLSPPPHEPT